MTSRLKRKLGEMGVDPSSSRANESFCLIGTPLPPLEKSKDTGEFVPLWKQEVRDEKGRRRLHGAFTGGFSAGYFNTVGSKEGWAPSTFTSSRNDRAKQKATRPEDFMDEEDLQDIKDGMNIVDTTDEMDLTGGTAAEKRRRGMEDDGDENSIANVLAATMSQPPKDSAGARILKKMGWKFGQGVGPRVTWHQRRMQDMQAGATPSVTEEDEEEASKHLYAPRDTALLIVSRKDDTHGLGYTPGISLHETHGEGKKNIDSNVSAGFGLGALNDADEDDLDVYDSGVNSGRSRIAYDIAEGGDEDRISIGRKSEQNTTTQNMSALSTQIFRDGRPVLSGFILSDKPIAEDRWFPLPDLPPGWKPDPKRVWQKDKNKENIKFDSHLSPETLHNHRKNGITADERGQILGEIPLPSAPRSVFEFMSQKDRERFKNMAQSAQNRSPDTTAEPSSQPVSSLFIPPIESHVAQSALTGFQPFSTNPPRQARYTAYLRSHLSPPTHNPLPLQTNQTIDEFNREMEEYKKSAMLFKPLGGAMAGRFTSAVVVEMGGKEVAGLHTPAPSTSEASQQQVDEGKQEQENVNPKVNAAKLGMYGPLTRETVPWQPARLLCKRFGVKDPNLSTTSLDPSSSEAAAAGTTPGMAARDVVSEFTGGMSFTAATSAAEFESATGVKAPGRRDIANIGMGDDEEQGKDILTYERPSMDIFKAIFASDDEDSADEAGGDEVDEEKMEGIESTVDASIMAPSSLPPAVADIPSADANEPVDPASFKPKFIPRDSKSKKEDKDVKKEKENSKKKKNKSTPTISFQMDDEGGDELQIKPSKDRPKKKRKSEKREKEGKKVVVNARQEDDEDDEMWVEKPPPELNTIVSSSIVVLDGGDGQAIGLAGRRKKAIDFM